MYVQRVADRVRASEHRRDVRRRRGQLVGVRVECEFSGELDHRVANSRLGQWLGDAHSGTITLTAGQAYSIKLEFFENSGGAVARLLWSGPSMAKQVIPTARLFSTP
jgi:hypothetical protein